MNVDEEHEQPYNRGVDIAHAGTDMTATLMGYIDTRAEQDGTPVWAVQDILGTLVMAGYADRESIRFPRYHRALGRLIIGKQLYRTKKGPAEA